MSNMQDTQQKCKLHKAYVFTEPHPYLWSSSSFIILTQVLHNSYHHSDAGFHHFYASFLQVYKACKSKGLEGDFLVACAHDVSFSNDNKFIETASRDAQDYAEVRKLDRRREANGAKQPAGFGTKVVASIVLSVFVVLL